ncbi:MAG: HAD family phosphatase [Spirochaetaceae bacterium]|jgi:HAD superfamily hydrolase (TIGR01509 family)|nr:HAD family phosphatase [Spirochaetaceae bacterium]
MITQTPFTPEAAIFDMDGLMLDTEKPVIEIWRQAAQAMGWQVDLEVLYQTIGINEAATKEILMRKYGPNFPYQEIRQNLQRILKEKIEREGIAHRPGLLVLLNRLDRLGVPLAVATSTSKQTALWKLDKAHIRERFKVMVFGDEVKQGKPAPDIFLLAAERLGKQPQNCVGFEDSPAGLQSLYRAGIPSVFIKDAVEPAPEILATLWRRYNDLAEAAALFG